MSKPDLFEEVQVATQDNTAAGTLLEPGVISSYDNGWKKLWKPFWTLFVIGIIAFIIGSVTSIPQFVAQLSGNFIPNTYLGYSDIAKYIWFASVLGIFALVFNLLVSGPIGYGVNFAYLKAARSDQVDVGDMFAAFRNYGHTVLAILLVMLITIVPVAILGFFFWLMSETGNVGLILFFVLLLFAIAVVLTIISCKLAFVPFLVVDKKMKAVDAIKGSWKMTNGHAWKVFLIGLMAIPVVIAGFICLIIGVIISCMWIYMAMASLYHAVSMKNTPPPPQPLPVNTAPPTV
jgi:uncharacterized membrane protein